MIARDCFVTGDTDGNRRVHVPVPVRWRDLDAYGHVNNATMFSLLEEARISAFWRAPDGSYDPTRPLAVVGAGDNADTITLIAAHSIEYRVPIGHALDPIDVEMWISEIGSASAEISYAVYSPVGDDPRLLHTVARSTIVLIDPETQRPRRINDDERAVWQPFLGERVAMRADRK